MDNCSVIDMPSFFSVKSDRYIYKVRKSDGLLLTLDTLVTEPRDIVIPHIFPSGHTINSLGKDFIYGRYNKVTISNGIKVNRCAFERSSVKEVVWPDDCEEIPFSCFLDSTIERISNIDNVSSVGESSFAGSHLEEIVWPSHCQKIPYKCFKDSRLSNIDNLHYVNEIEQLAFKNSDMSSIDLSTANVVFLAPGSLAGLSLKKSVPSYYLSEIEWKNAFLMP